MTIQFQKAERHSVKLKIAVDGPSGSGKTLGALALAHGITKGGRIAVADSENKSASLYSDRYDAVARLLVHGFHYGALLSEAGGEPAAADGLQAAFAGHDFLLTRVHSLDSLDIYLDAGFVAGRPDLLEVYPYERHLKNYVQVFRRQYARVRGRL